MAVTMWNPRGWSIQVISHLKYFIPSSKVLFIICDTGQVRKHLTAEALYNPSPYGLTVVTTTGIAPAPKVPAKSTHSSVEVTAHAAASNADTAAAVGDACSEAVSRAKYDSVWMQGAPDW